MTNKRPYAIMRFSKAPVQQPRDAEYGKSTASRDVRRQRKLLLLPGTDRSAYSFANVALQRQSDSVLASILSGLQLLSAA